MFSTGTTSDTLLAPDQQRAGATGDTVVCAGPVPAVGRPTGTASTETAASVVFSIDGTVVSTRAVAIGASMRLVASEYNVGGPVVSVDWMRMTPYASSGTFLSRIFDAGASAGWLDLSWTADLPAGTSIQMSVRTGDTPSPDGTWSDFAAIPASGGAIGATSQYLQYRAALSTTDDGQTPSLQDVTIDYSPGLDQTPPTVQSVAPADGATDIAVSTDVTAAFSEAMDAATIDGATFTLTPDGGAPVDATVSYDPGTKTATLHPTATWPPARDTPRPSPRAWRTPRATTWRPPTRGASPPAWHRFGTTVADFSAGDPGTGTSVGNAAGGESCWLRRSGPSSRGPPCRRAGTAPSGPRPTGRRRWPAACSPSTVPRPGPGHVRPRTLARVRGHLCRNALPAPRIA